MGSQNCRGKTQGAHEGVYQAFLYKTYPFRTFKNPPLWAICLRVPKDLPLAGHIPTHLIHKLHSICNVTVQVVRSGDMAWPVARSRDACV